MPVRTQGAALIVALFIVALAASIATALIIRLQFAIYRTREIISYDQMYLYAQAMVAWAQDDLANNLTYAKPNQPVDKLPVVMKPQKMGTTQVSGTITDMQSCFNINSILQPAQQAQFLRLLQITAPTLSPNQDQQLLAALKSWLQQSEGLNQFDNLYMKSQPPYRAGHQLMASVSELRLVAGVTATVYQQLSPYLCALPDPGVNAINVNTAPAPVLMLINPAITLELAQQIIAQRQNQPFLSSAQFSNLPQLQKFHIDDSNITILSSYFLVTATVKQGSQDLQLFALLKRQKNNNAPNNNQKNNKAEVTVVWQTQGTL